MIDRNRVFKGICRKLFGKLTADQGHRIIGMLESEINQI